MIKSTLIAAAVAVPVNLLCAPVFAENLTSPKPVAEVPTKSMLSSFSMTGSTPPTMALYDTAINNNIACRNAARSKFFELGARDMSSSDSNSQWATIGTNMRALVWCRDTRATIAVTGYSYDAVTEARDAIVKAF